MILRVIDKAQSDLELAKGLIYDQFGFKLANLKLAKESLAYAACSFYLNEKKIEYRVSKITPAKSGQFVSIWKRNENGLTVPYDSSDDFDFLVISSRTKDNWGQFIFPKAALVSNGIISKLGIGGKRGIRVYATWDRVLNKQAEKTKSWQTKYFIAFNQIDKSLFEILHKLLSN